MKKESKIFIIAGEASGDILGADLMKSIIKKNPDVVFCGVGGEEMNKIPSFKSLFNIRDIAVMGFVEVLKNLFTIKKRIKQTVQKILKFKPDVVITIDAPGFNMNVVKKVKGQLPNTKFIHYVAPQVWAWKEKRAKKIAEVFDYLLCLFPFEPAYFEKYGLKCIVVGHTAIQNIKGNPDRFLKQNNISVDDVVITLLPGTRKQMAEKLLPIYSDVVDELYNKIKNVKIVIPTTENMKYFIFNETKCWKREPIIITGKQNRYDAFLASSVALAISGTSVLELALAGTPTVVAYKISPITYCIAKRLVKIKYVSLPNIIMEREIVPEFIQGECTVPKLLNAMVKSISDKKYIEKYRKNVELLKNKMYGESPKSPSDKAAEAVLKIIK